MKGARPFISDRRGAAALEFALLGLPFVLLLLGLIEFGRGLYLRNALDAAADRAQRVIMIDPSANAAALDTAILASFRMGQMENLTIAYTTDTIAGHRYRLVSLDYAMQLLLPAPLGGTLTLGSTRRVAILD